MPQMDERRRCKMVDDVVQAVAIRDLTSGLRAQQELPPLDVTVCLGAGRCMLIRPKEGITVCPFCLVYDGAHHRLAADTIIGDVSRRLIRGN